MMQYWEEVNLTKINLNYANLSDAIIPEVNEAETVLVMALK